MGVRPRNYTGRGYAPEIWEEVRRRHEAGETAIALSKIFGMRPGTIHTRASAEKWQRCGGGERVKRATRVHVSEPAWLQIYDLYERGATASHIVGLFQCSESSVRKRLHRNGRSKTKSAKPPIEFPPEPEPPPPPPWKDIAHPAQLSPAGRWSTWLFQGGRGAGKTRAGAEWLAAQANANPKGIFALVGATLHDVREVMIEGPAGLMNLPGLTGLRFESSRRRLIFPQGAVAYAFSSEEPRRLRGPQFDGAWADEFCAWQHPRDTLDTLRLGLRRGPDPRLVVTTTPKPIPELRALRAERSCVVTQAGSAANAGNLSPRFLEGLLEIYGDTTLAAQEIEGVLVDGHANAVWTPETLRGVRGRVPEAFDRIVVAVDPPAGTSSGANGSACGIIVAGRRGRRGYVLADHSVAGLSPLGWATRVSAAARDFGAQAIVAEANQGGDMVRATLATAGAPCAIDLVRAQVSKKARATPVAALYERGRITHCGAFVQLEEELMALDANRDVPFDRADALVWALTVLMLDDAGEGPWLRTLASDPSPRP
jgi:phage terminase large subunit-like protein